MLKAVHMVGIGYNPELAGMFRGQPCFRSPFHQLFLTKPVGAQISDGGDFQIMLLCENLQIRHAGHCSVFFHNFADDPGGPHARNPGQINGTLRLPGTDEHAAFTGAKGKNMAGADDVPRCCLGVHRSFNGPGPVSSGDSRTDTCPGLYGDGKTGSKGRLVIRHHHSAVPIAR